MRIGVFDSGIGGQAVADALQLHYPEAKILVVNDRKHLPYGDKTQDEIQYLTHAAIQPLLEEACDVIIIACNSATTAALSSLREAYPEQLFLGVEPMIKTAARLTKTGKIAVCATPATLSSKRYAELKQHYGTDATFIEPDCHDWASMIEANEMQQEKIDSVIGSVLDEGADVIVLGCTHYHWIKQEIEDLAVNRAVVVEPSQALAKRLETFLNPEVN